MQIHVVRPGDTLCLPCAKAKNYVNGTRIISHRECFKHPINIHRSNYTSKLGGSYALGHKKA